MRSCCRLLALLRISEDHLVSAVPAVGSERRAPPEPPKLGAGVPAEAGPAAAPRQGQIVFGCLARGTSDPKASPEETVASRG